MKKNKLFLTLALLFFLHTAYSQSLAVGYRAELGSFSSDRFRYVLQTFSNWNLPVKTTEDFPPYLIHRAEISVIWEKNKMGLFYQYLTTGARKTLSDYSGSIYFDAIVNDQQYGLFFDQRIRKVNNFSFFGYLEGAYSATELKLVNRLNIYNNSYIPEGNNELYTTKGYGIEPGIKTTYSINRIQLQLNIGYQIIFNSALKNNGETCFYVKNREMSGFRAGIQVDYKLIGMRKKE